MNVSLFTLIFLSSTTDNTLSGLDYDKHVDRFIRHWNNLPCPNTWVHPRFFVGYVLLIFLVFCLVLCFNLFLSSFCVLYQMLPISLNYPFLIASSNFFSLTCIHTVIPIVILIYLTVTYLVYVYETKVNNDFLSFAL